MIRRSNKHRINIFQRKNFIEVAVDFCASVGTLLRTFEATFVRVTNRRDFDAANIFCVFDNLMRTPMKPTLTRLFGLVVCALVMNVIEVVAAAVVAAVDLMNSRRLMFLLIIFVLQVFQFH
jgi:hypothetical protein